MIKFCLLSWAGRNYICSYIYYYKCGKKRDSINKITFLKQIYILIDKKIKNYQIL